ncbi:MAG: tRNA uridine-5-carboxymethylaminomethyl(34) synthesis GTPase MnmE [Azospirillaceae bacterium]
MRRTIFAPATAPGRAALAVVRISGPSAGAALAALTARPAPAPRRASLRRLSDSGGEAIDEALVLWFPGPGSATGEDVAELHLHGGRAVLAGVLDSLAELPDLRPAEAGEFTRRAFENGRLDLTEAEAVADLVDAETRAQQRQALRQLDGALGRLYDGWRQRLVRALAHLEADLDFPDEELPAGVAAAVVPDLAAVASEIEDHLADSGRGERLREGLEIAILGPPNAGKSSLINAIARRDVAIVAETAGTTRDVLEVHLDLGGYPVVLADTAGLREAAADAVETEGIRRARARAERAGLRLLVFDAADWPEPDPGLRALADGDALWVANKIDKAPLPDAGAEAGDDRSFDGRLLDGRPVLGVSALTGDGIAALLDRLGEAVADRLAPGAAPSLTRARHRQALEDAAAALRRAEAAALPELVAEDARLAVRALGRITGRVDVEDLLDIIFHDFCIGK